MDVQTSCSSVYFMIAVTIQWQGRSHRVILLYAGSLLDWRGANWPPLPILSLMFVRGLKFVQNLKMHIQKTINKTMRVLKVPFETLLIHIYIIYFNFRFLYCYTAKVYIHSTLERMSWIRSIFFSSAIQK